MIRLSKTTTTPILMMMIMFGVVGSLLKAVPKCTAAFTTTTKRSVAFVTSSSTTSWSSLIQQQQWPMTTRSASSLASIIASSSSSCPHSSSFLILPTQQRRTFALQGKPSLSDNDNDDDDEDELPPLEIPDTIDIPEGQLSISFARSGGAGGQNVNKVNTKVEIRFVLENAEWIGPSEVRERLAKQQCGRLNKDGEFFITSSEHRTQSANRKSALAKLEEMILKAYPRPVKRKKKKGPSKKAKERKKEAKKRQSAKKALRGRVNMSDY